MSKAATIHRLPDATIQAGLRTQRQQLLEAAVRYVRDGQDGTLNDRLRTASDLSGIPLKLIEIEVKR